jgi:hypothetical protein
MRIKFIKSCIVALTLLMTFGCPMSFRTISFTANMILGTNYRQITGKIFVKNNEYRMDIKQFKEELSILGNREKGKHIVMAHSAKTAREFLNTNPQSLSNNPLEYFYYLLENNSSRKKGSEVTGGYKCRKIELYEKDKNLATAWFSKKLNWPIKFETHDQSKRYIILSNIKEEPVEDSVFQIPEDYKFYPLPPDRKEKKIKPKKIEALRPKKKAALEKLIENGIEYKTGDGTLFLRAFGGTALSQSFPGWFFFLIDRVKDGKITSGNTPKMRAAVSKDDKNIYILYIPETDKALNNGLKMVQDQNIKLTNEKDVEKLGEALFFLYFRGSKLEKVESLGENEWAIYRKSTSEYLDGLVLKINDNGELTELNYKTKIKKQQ